MDLVSKSIKVPQDLWQKARAKALNENMTMQDLIEKLLKDYLEKEA